jgi:hypothetical protein
VWRSGNAQSRHAICQDLLDPNTAKVIISEDVTNLKFILARGILKLEESWNQTIYIGK